MSACPGGDSKWPVTETPIRQKEGERQALQGQEALLCLLHVVPVLGSVATIQSPALLQSRLYLLRSL